MAERELQNRDSTGAKPRADEENGNDSVPATGDLCALLDELRAERDRLLAELASRERVEHEISQEATEPRDPVDLGAAQRDIDREEAVAARVARRVDAIQDALERAAQSRLGICEHCGGAIGLGRLRAMPEASLCSSCAHELQRHGFS